MLGRFASLCDFTPGPLISTDYEVRGWSRMFVDNWR